ncbi:MAG: butanol dehydrogenase [Firmicutes bacterium GWF2_51_9]|nr:MAG: butanol dehydrogenase [Firmicutes bacterium GWF2_51_9]OGS57467.1 MAG: butanol dehydrogenase [Firmicutes bacterium GWE2_51_13]HAM63951.1 NADH-dependent alcohol dehydrogenase [Erysipelotrichaceae bacterium]
MDNFKFHAYTEILFGKGQIQQLPAVLSKYGKNVLLAYGSGSIKKNGIYDSIQSLLSDFNVIDFADIEPNPHLKTVERGRDLCLAHNVDVILAVGGGSVIDCSKVVAAATFYDGSAWDLVENSTKITKALPIVTVLTMAGTGSEMNKGAVITNTETQVKRGTGSWKTIPQTSIIDPTYLYTLPAKQTAAGSADIFSHVLESYFKRTPDAYVQDRMAEAILLTVIKYAPIAMVYPEDYSARANLAWASSLALNGILGSGKNGAWSVHPIEHELSAYYDLTHGIGLAILTPPWMRHILNEDTVDKFCEYGVNVWKIPSDMPRFDLANAAIDATETFFESLKIPMTLHEVGIDESKFEIMAKKAVELGGLAYAYVPMNEKDVIEILEACK